MTNLTALEPRKDYILLKWGTIKGWEFHKPESRALMQRYIDAGMSYSAMTREDAPEQRQILCDLIRQHEGKIQNDWDGEFYTIDEALDYIENYGK